MWILDPDEPASMTMPKCLFFSHASEWIEVISRGWIVQTASAMECKDNECEKMKRAKKLVQGGKDV
jgi:hypothetical protein